MDMDENGRNGWNWHLAQQLTYHVIIYVISLTTIHIARNAIQTPTTSTPCNRLGDFYFSYKDQKFPPYTIIIIYNLLTNRWLKYGIIWIVE